MSRLVEGDVLTVNETASLLRISRNTCYRLIKAGQLPAFEVGGQYRILASELDPSTTEHPETRRFPK